MHQKTTDDFMPKCRTCNQPLKIDNIDEIVVTEDIQREFAVEDWDQFAGVRKLLMDKK